MMISQNYFGLFYPIGSTDTLIESISRGLRVKIGA